jgi:casein kinase II subunit beta
MDHYVCALLSKDDFNLTGLNGLVPYYDYALDMVLDVEMPMEDSLTEVRLWSG